MKRLLKWLADRLATKKIKVWRISLCNLQDTINDAHRMLESHGCEIVDVKVRDSAYIYRATIYYRKRKAESK